VYVAAEARGAGVGSVLLAALIGRAQELGYHKLVLAAFPFNEAGMRLYRRFGFREVGTYREQGLLDGQWVDVVIMERLLDESSGRGVEESRSSPEL
jgi:phosphinothricin acetyltransferase